MGARNWTWSFSRVASFDKCWPISSSLPPLFPAVIPTLSIVGTIVRILKRSFFFLSHDSLWTFRDTTGIFCCFSISERKILYFFPLVQIANCSDLLWTRVVCCAVNLWIPQNLGIKYNGLVPCSLQLQIFLRSL